jgi:hypothetical protein
VGEALAVAVDDAGNVYVAATDMTKLNALTITKFKRM